MYEIELVGADKKMWISERLIHSIVPNNDGTYTLYHFNDKKIQIKYFVKL